MNKQVQRIQADTQVGLTADQVDQRVSQKQTNKVKKVVGKSYLQIFTSNIFTFFNLLGFIIFILIIKIEGKNYYQTKYYIGFLTVSLGF